MKIWTGLLRLFAFFLIAQMANKTTITIPLLTTDAEFSSKLKESQALVGKILKRLTTGVSGGCVL
jgi:hypothetical protein